MMRSSSKPISMDREAWPTANDRVIELDFEGVRTLGQGFADEVFRIRQSQHPDIRIVPANASETVLFMIRRGNPGLQLVNDFNLPHD
jgi:hypothetical protein